MTDQEIIESQKLTIDGLQKSVAALHSELDRRDSQANTEAVAEFSGYIDGQTPTIQWLGAALPVGAKFYGAVQAASQSGELADGLAKMQQLVKFISNPGSIYLEYGEVAAEAYRALAARPATPSPVQAQSDLMPKRAAFIAHCEKRGLETVEDKDAWGKRKFKHSHIEAMWEGWFNAPTAAPSQPVAAVPEARELTDKQKANIERAAAFVHGEGKLQLADSLRGILRHLSGATPAQEG